jgi:uncharacterized FlaG/YvyC family protein
MEIIPPSALGRSLSPSASEPVPAEHFQLIQAVKAVNAASVLGDHAEIQFSIDRRTRLPIIKVLDRNTKEVIDQVPSEYILRLASDLPSNSE